MFLFVLDADLEKIQVDPINRKIFYADTGNNIIATINMDGSGYKVIVNQSLDEPRDLAVVPATQYDYYIAYLHYTITLHYYITQLHETLHTCTFVCVLKQLLS